MLKAASSCDPSENRHRILAPPWIANHLAIATSNLVNSPFLISCELNSVTSLSDLIEAQNADSTAKMSTSKTGGHKARERETSG